MNLVIQRSYAGQKDIKIYNFDSRLYSFTAFALTVFSAAYCITGGLSNLVKGHNATILSQALESKRSKVLTQRRNNQQNLEEASKPLPTEVSLEASRLETLQNQYQKLREQHEEMGQSLNKLEESLYPK